MRGADQQSSIQALRRSLDQCSERMFRGSRPPNRTYTLSLRASTGSTLSARTIGPMQASAHTKKATTGMAPSTRSNSFNRSAVSRTWSRSLAVMTTDGSFTSERLPRAMLDADSEFFRYIDSTSSQR